MKRILVILFILNLSVANAQIGIEGGVYGEYFRMDAGYRSGSNIFSGGAIAYVQLGKFYTLNYRIGGGNYSSTYAYLHCPTSWAVASLLSHDNKAAILLGIIPEGIGFYTRQDHTGIHISLNLLGFEYFHKRKSWNDDFEVRPDFICRYRFRKESKFQMVSPYAALTLHYIPRERKFPDFKLGIALTFESGKREKKASNEEDENIRQKTKNKIFHRN